MARKLGQFIQKEHPIVCEGNLSWGDPGTSSDQGRCRSAMVWCTKRSTLPVPTIKAKVGDGINSRRVEGFTGRHIRQNASKSLGQHGFAAPGRSHHHERVASSGSNLKRAHAEGLSIDIAQISPERSLLTL